MFGYDRLNLGFKFPKLKVSSRFIFFKDINRLHGELKLKEGSIKHQTIRLPLFVFFTVYPAGAVTSLRSNRVATSNNKVTLREKMDSEFN